MQTGSQEYGREQQDGIAVAVREGAPIEKPTRPYSAFLGLRVAAPLALLLWVLAITALWTLLR